MLRYMVVACLIIVIVVVLKEASKGRGFKDASKWLLGITNPPENSSIDLTITVIIPAYNEESHIGATINSIKRQTHPVNEIIVINDSSTDNTAQVAKSMGVKVLTTEVNSGTKAQAQQFGLQHVDTDLVINVDADTVLDPRAIEKILPAFADRDVVTACSLVIPQKIDTFWEKSRFIEYLFGIPIFKAGQDLWNGVLVSSGCFSTFRVSDLKGIGGFPDRSMAEDMDATWMLLEKGKKVKLVCDAICYPLDPPNYYIYHNQVERWFRGFLQNIYVHRWRLLKNKSAFFFAMWNLIGGILFPLSLIVMVILIYRLRMISLLFLTLELLIVAISSLVIAKRLNMTGLAFRSLPSFFIVRYVNLYLFINYIIIFKFFFCIF